MPEKQRIITNRLEYLNRPDFIKSMRKLLRSGGAKQQAAEKVKQIIASIDLGFSDIGKLTNFGEKRIKHCVKYDLPGGCRLVTVQKNSVICLLFIGDHEETDRWLERNKGLILTAQQENPTIISVTHAETFDSIFYHCMRLMHGLGIEGLSPVVLSKSSND